MGLLDKSKFLFPIPNKSFC